jgi:hypothetical protein
MTETFTALEVNALTGEQIVRDLTADELLDLQEIQAASKAQETEAKARAAARTSALAKLADLGLTAEEIAAL